METSIVICNKHITKSMYLDYKINAQFKYIAAYVIKVCTSSMDDRSLCYDLEK